MAREPRSLRVSRNFRFILSLFVAVLCLGYLLWKVDLRSLLRLLAQADLCLLGVVGLLNTLVLIAKAERWRYLISPLVSLTPLESFCLTVLGFWGNVIFPARAGDLGRGLYLSRRNVNWATGVSTVVVDKLLDALGLVSLVTPLFFSPSLVPLLRQGALFLGAFTAGALFLSLYLSHHFEPADLAKAKGTLRRTLVALALGTKGLRHGGLLGKGFLLSILAWIFQVAMLLYSAKALGLSLPLSVVLLTLLGLNIALVLPNPPAGIGLTHAAIVIVLGFFGYPKAQALGIAVVYHGVQIITLCILGPIFWILKEKILPDEHNQVKMG